jgi:hypothetical protein
MFDTGPMAPRRAAEIEGLRRSAAIAALSPSTMQELLDDYQDALARLERVGEVLRKLGPPWQASRDALNELSRALQD